MSRPKISDCATANPPTARIVTATTDSTIVNPPSSRSIRRRNDGRRRRARRAYGGSSSSLPSARVRASLNDETPELPTTSLHEPLCPVRRSHHPGRDTQKGRPGGPPLLVVRDWLVRVGHASPAAPSVRVPVQLAAAVVAVERSRTGAGGNLVDPVARAGLRQRRSGELLVRLSATTAADRDRDRRRAGRRHQRWYFERRLDRLQASRRRHQRSRWCPCTPSWPRPARCAGSTGRRGSGPAHGHRGTSAARWRSGCR